MDRLLRVLCFIALPLVVAPTSGCGGTRYAIAGNAQVYTLTNMHADRRSRVSSVNYQNGQRIAICTPVNIRRVQGRRATFEDARTGVRYTYTMHRSARTTIDQHLARYFGTGCPDLSSLSPEDVSGIQNGQVYQGMSKQGVIMALGYPPEHRTPTLNQDVWRYWQTRMGTFEVYFSDGVVTGIRR